MEVLQMFRRKAETRMVELSPDEARLLRGALFAEGIVFWKDGQPQCKIKRSDFGFPWGE